MEHCIDQRVGTRSCCSDRNGKSEGGTARANTHTHTRTEHTLVSETPQEPLVGDPPPLPGSRARHKLHVSANVLVLVGQLLRRREIWASTRKEQGMFRKKYHSNSTCYE